MTLIYFFDTRFQLLLTSCLLASWHDCWRLHIILFLFVLLLKVKPGINQVNLASCCVMPEVSSLAAWNASSKILFIDFVILNVGAVTTTWASLSCSCQSQFIGKNVLNWWSKVSFQWNRIQNDHFSFGTFYCRILCNLVRNMISSCWHMLIQKVFHCLEKTSF